MNETQAMEHLIGCAETLVDLAKDEDVSEGDLRLYIVTALERALAEVTEQATC